jgi:hypothetical protein
MLKENEVRKFIAFITLTFLVGCSITPEQRHADSVVHNCMRIADNATPFEKHYINSTCSLSGSVNKGGFISGTQICEPNYKSCRNGKTWESNFMACIQGKNVSRRDMSPIGQLSFSFKPNEFC